MNRVLSLIFSRGFSSSFSTVWSEKKQKKYGELYADVHHKDWTEIWADLQHKQHKGRTDTEGLQLLILPKQNVVIVKQALYQLIINLQNIKHNCK